MNSRVVPELRKFVLYHSTTAIELRSSFGDWLAELASWNWFATFTFRNPSNPKFPGWSQVGWKSAHNALKKWSAALDFHLTCDIGHEVQAKWAAVMEIQPGRGCPHWHLLIADTGEQRRMSWVDWWFREFGIARVLPYKQELGARYYLGKYLTKEIADIQVSPGLSQKIIDSHKKITNSHKKSQTGIITREILKPGEELDKKIRSGYHKDTKGL